MLFINRSIQYWYGEEMAGWQYSMHADSLMRDVSTHRGRASAYQQTVSFKFGSKCTYKEATTETIMMIILPYWDWICVDPGKAGEAKGQRRGGVIRIPKGLSKSGFV